MIAALMPTAQFQLTLDDAKRYLRLVDLTPADSFAHAVLEVAKDEADRIEVATHEGDSDEAMREFALRELADIMLERGIISQEQNDQVFGHCLGL